MCKYCKCEEGELTSESIIQQKINLGMFGKETLYINIIQTMENKTLLFGGFGDRFMFEREIKFCPMCGRKL